MAERREFETLSFLGLVIGGILILVGGLMGALYMNAWGWGGMMSNGMMGTPAASGGQGATNWWFGGLGLLTGVVILIASSRIYAQRDVGTWSVVAIAAGALSVFAMGGFMIGAAAAIVGGALALVDQQRQAPRSGGA